MTTNEKQTTSVQDHPTMTLTDEGTYLVPSGLRAQRRFVAERIKKEAGFDLMIADSFVRGIRELGYKSNAHAVDELVDNSQQAGATNIHIAFGFTGNSDAKPTELAIIDDGHGMDAEMIRVAMMWGGTHREGSREGFGRFGFGLPSASMSIAREYTVYSWTRDVSEVKGATFSLDALAAGDYRAPDGRTAVPAAVTAKLPDWVRGYIAESFPGGIPVSGTVVLLNKLDGLEWKTAKVLGDKLVDHIGVVYRNFLDAVSVVVNGIAVAPVDPLFVNPKARFYDGDAQELPPSNIEVKDPNTGGSLGVVKIRYSYLPPAAFSKTYANKKELNKARRKIMEANHGIIVLRHGRQIDIVRNFPKNGLWYSALQNNDVFFKVEIDLPATLDEFASVTTSKQQIVFKEQIWEILEQAGVHRMQKQRREQINGELHALRASKGKDRQEPRPSEEVMNEVAKFKTRRSEAVPAERAAEAERNKQEHIRTRAARENLPAVVVEQELEFETKTTKYVVENEDLPGAPFYRVIPRGGQIVLLVNKGHRFYSEVYAAYESSPQLRSALEIMLFVMGEAELDANSERRRFYENERAEWSRVLNTALDRLREIDASETEPAGDDVEDEAEPVLAIVN